MTLTSKFNTFYLIGKVIGPIVFALLFVLFLHQGIVQGNSGYIGISLFFFIVGLVVLISNLKSLCTLTVEDSGIRQKFVYTNREEYLPFSGIKNSHLEYIEGNETEGGQASLGYYQCIFILDDNTEFIISPVKFENYNELIRAISHNRTELSDKS